MKLLSFLLVYHAIFACLHFALQIVSELNTWQMVNVWVTNGMVLYGVHRLAHESFCVQWARLWYRVHMIGHHFRCFPFKRFQMPEYVVNPFDVWRFGTWIYVLPMITVTQGHAWWWQWSCAQNGHALLVLFCAASLEEWIHGYLHLQHTRFDHYKWFQLLQTLHAQHHRYLSCNYGVVNMSFDVLFRSLKYPKSQ